MSSKITQKAVLFSSDKQIHFSGAIHRVDTKGGEKYGTLQRISCMAYLLRRTYAVAAGVLALPFTLFWKDRARFYSYLHRVWSKTSDKPVWMDQAEKATGDFY